MCYDNMKYYNTDVNVNMQAVSKTSKTSFPHKIRKIYSDYKSLINDENVDVIDICVPNFYIKKF